MGLRAKVNRLEKAMRGKLEHIELADGSRHYFDPHEAFSITFGFFNDCLMAEYEGEPYPEATDLLKAVAGAKERGEALRRVMGGGSHLPLDREALIERGELVARSLRAGREADGPSLGYGDLSEP
jgi:hypothetical protein